MYISKYFTWNEALYLPQYKREATEKDGVTQEIKANLTKLFNKMDDIRDFFQHPIIVHVAYRSPEYNSLVKGAKNSAHLFGLACDFHVSGLSCDDAKKMILTADLLNKYNLRMEDNGIGAGWIHLDIRDLAPGGSRYFHP